MTNPIEQYLLKLHDSEKILIIKGYEQLTKDGFIGDEPIRIHASALMQELGSGNVVVWMTQLAFEAYRYFAKAYLVEFPGTGYNKT